MAGIAAGRNKEGAGVNYSGVAKSARIASAMVFSTYKTEQFCGKGVATCTRSNEVDVRAALNYLYTVHTMFKLMHPSLRLNAVNASISGNQTVTDYCKGHPTGPMVTYLTNASVPVVASVGNLGMSAISSGIDRHLRRGRQNQRTHHR
jgi:hypothetical protein